ncbi:MAG: DUF4097 family beta strand repeat protein [Phycisphaeraceae bacterium]|nr:DUF4097 family beta strand repeat protein [Phycisphaeraceae bacterium]
MRIGMPAGLVAGSIVLVASALGAETINETREMTVATAPGLALTVKTSNGGIQIVPTDSSEMRIKATVSAKSRERLEAIRISASNDAVKGNDVHVDFPPSIKGEEEGCSLVIEVPRAKEVSLNTTNGGLSLSGTGGNARLETSNGAVSIKGHDGPATIHSSNGPVTVSSISGRATIHTSNAPVTVKGAAQPFEIETSNGPVQVSLATGFSGVVSIVTSNGKISLPKDAKVDSAASNKSSGSASAKATIGSGGTDSSITTSNGPVDLKNSPR